MTNILTKINYIFIYSTTYLQGLGPDLQKCGAVLVGCNFEEDIKASQKQHHCAKMACNDIL